MRMIKKYSVSVLAAMVAASFSISAQANEGLEVVDLGTLPGAYVTFPGGMNDIGEAVVVNRNLWQQNIRFDLLADLEAFEDFDFDNITDSEYRSIRDFLNSPSGFGGSPAYQKLAIQISHLYDGAEQALEGFDILDPETNRFTDSVNYVANDINGHRVVVGNAGEPYLRQTTTDLEGQQTEYFMRDSFPRAFVWFNDEVTFLPSTADVYLGGTGDARAINESNVIVGRAAIKNTTGLDNAFNSCLAEPEEDGQSGVFNEELNVCIWRYWYSNEVGPVAQGSGRSPIFIEQAHKWTLNEDGSINAALLGGFSREIVPTEEQIAEGVEPEIRQLPSRALDINEQGVAVGSAQRFVTAINARGDEVENASVLSSVAFKNGEIIPLQQEFLTSTSEATAINDRNIIVGYSTLNVGNANRPRAFWVDLEQVDSGRNYPTGFFTTSGWRPRAVNNHNVMVGQGEVTAQVGSARPTVGFMYDIETDTITDLNSLLPCGSDYRIVDAYDINDSGEILALAVTEVAIPVNGNLETTGRLRAVRLQAGSAQPCNELPESAERQGAQVSPIIAGLMALFGLLITRRRFKRA